MYVTEKEKDALLEACDFIRTNADCADDFEPFEELCGKLMTMYHKAKKEIFNRRKKKSITSNKIT